MTVKLSDKEAEQQLRNEIVEEKSATRWQVKATRYGMGDHSDLPICRNNLQQRRLHEQSQPLQ
jgi:hypothetical protein